MAVQGPKVGSSAKAETGKSSMKEAGQVLGLGTPFKMSEMIGKGGSVSTGNLVAKRYEEDQYPDLYQEFGWNSKHNIGSYAGSISVAGGTLIGIFVIDDYFEYWGSSKLYYAIEANNISGTKKARMYMPNKEEVYELTYDERGFKLWMAEAKDGQKLYEQFRALKTFDVYVEFYD